MELLSAREIGEVLGCTDRAVMNWVKKGELQVSAIGKTAFNKPVNLFDIDEARQARQRLLDKKSSSAAMTLDKVRRVNAAPVLLRGAGMHTTARTVMHNDLERQADGIQLKKDLRELWRMVHGSTR